MGLLSNRAADVPEAIKAPATNLTLGSATAATIATLVVAFNESFDSIFGQSAGPNIKAAVLIAVIAAWTLVAVADIIGRAIAKAATERAGGAEAAAKAAAKPVPAILPMAAALKVERLRGRDGPGFLAVGQRTDGTNSIMLVKAGRPPEWVECDEVELST